jgi:hypothetical protein
MITFNISVLGFPDQRTSMIFAGGGSPNIWRAEKKKTRKRYSRIRKQRAMAATVPDWVSLGAEKTEGLDLLGLRAPVQRIGNDLFDGITTVTPKVRYLSVLTWITRRYTEARLPNGWSPFSRFAEAQEAMIVLANRMQSKTILNLVGVTKADELLRGEGQRLPLPRLAQNIAYNIYVTTSRQLHLTHDEGSAIGGLTKDRGLKLAVALFCGTRHGVGVCCPPIPRRFTAPGISTSTLLAGHMRTYHWRWPLYRTRSRMRLPFLEGSDKILPAPVEIRLIGEARWRDSDLGRRFGI